MEEASSIVGEAITTGSILAAGSPAASIDTDLMALTIALLLTALSMCVIAAYRTTTGSMRMPHSEPSPPALHRRLTGPRDRRL